LEGRTTKTTWWWFCWAKKTTKITEGKKKTGEVKNPHVTTTALATKEGRRRWGWDEPLGNQGGVLRGREKTQVGSKGGEKKGKKQKKNAA